MAIDDIYTEDYSPKSFIVRGNTKKYKEELLKMGGKYNSRLKDDESESGVSPGWIFSKTKIDLLREFLSKEQPTESKSCNCEDLLIEMTEIKKQINSMNAKIDKIAAHFDQAEKIRDNLMSKTNNIMGNIFGMRRHVEPEVKIEILETEPGPNRNFIEIL